MATLKQAIKDLSGRKVAGSHGQKEDIQANKVILTKEGDIADRLTVPRKTTAQRDALTNLTDGMVLYNTTTDKLTMRADGAWVEVASGTIGVSSGGTGVTGLISGQLLALNESSVVSGSKVVSIVGQSVGIGNINPPEILSISGNTVEGGNVTIRVENLRGDGYEGIDLYNASGTRICTLAVSNTGATTNADSAWIGTRTNKKLHLVTDGTVPRLTISGANVGIGTETPGELFVVNGNAKANVFKIATGTATAPGFTIDGDTDTGIYQAAANQLALTAAGGEVVRVGTGGLGVLTKAAAGASLHVSGSLALGCSDPFVSANKTLGIDDFYVPCDSTGGAFRITLPTAVGIKGRMYAITLVSGSNQITISGQELERVGGQVSYNLTSTNQSALVISDGLGWQTI